MEQALLIIETYQGWIYAILGLAAIVYLRSAIKWRSEFRRSVYGLERDRAVSQLTRTLAMLAFVGAVAIATFLVATFLVPKVPIAARPTPIPTISLLLTVPSVGVLTREADVSAGTLVPTAVPSEDGCLNPSASISSPLPGEELRGRVEILGTADIPSFAFYKIEIRTADPNSPWRAVTAGTAPVVDGLLGVWDTSLSQSGRYYLQLVVTDTVGNAPLPCTFEVVVLPPEA